MAGWATSHAPVITVPVMVSSALGPNESHREHDNGGAGAECEQSGRPESRGDHRDVYVDSDEDDDSQVEEDDNENDEEDSHSSEDEDDYPGIGYPSHPTAADHDSEDDEEDDLVDYQPASPTRIAALLRQPYSTISHASNDDCAICLEDFTTNQNVIALPCGHVFCADGSGCIGRGVVEWLVERFSTCPRCHGSVYDAPSVWAGRGRSVEDGAGALTRGGLGI